MTITYPVALPSNNIQSLTISLNNAVAVTESAFSFQQQAVDWQGSAWSLDFTPPPMVRADADVWKGFLASLRGRYGTFLAGDPVGQTPKGTWGGTPVVNGASQTGYTLAIDGLTHNVTGIVKAGDWFQLGTGASSRLHMVVADASSNGSGQATLDIVPPLRSSPADNASITTSSAKGVFRLSENSVSWSVDYDGMVRLGFRAFEVV